MSRSFIKRLGTAGVCLGLAMAVPANAYTFLDGEFNVNVDSYSGNTGVFTYTIDFTNWSGAANYLIAVDFGLSNPKVASINSLTTNAVGGWTAVIGSSSANGCGGGSSVFACANDDPFDWPNGQPTTGTVYFTFNVTFDAALSPSQWLDSDNHIGAFFLTCETTAVTNGKQCTPGSGLSDTTTFTDSDSDTDSDVPEPGTLALLGLGLIGLGAARRRKI